MSFRLPVIFLLCLTSLPAIAAPPDIVLITLDTTRADRMGFLGSKRALTPNLDALAKEGVVFERAYAQEPLTTPSHAALLTGTYPQFNHVQDLGEPLSKDLPYLPDILRQHGYRTAAFVGSYILDSKGAAAGFERGFVTYDAGFHKRRSGEDRYKTVERRARDVVDHALAWLRTHPQGPYFLWLHFYDAHDPYDPPEPFKSRFASAPYDGEIAYTDAMVGKFLAALRAKGLYQGAMVVVAADHGEAFGEHGEQRHGMFLYDETIHVPLVMKRPMNRGAGRRVGARLGLADVAPTILREAGIAVPSAMQGVAQNDQMTPGTENKGGDRAIYSETDYPHRAFNWSLLRSWRTGKYLYVQAPKRELYDQSNDPGAERNLAAASTAVADTLESQLEAFQRKTTSEKKEQAKLDPAQEENLRALGYLASGAGQHDDGKETGADPKDKIEIANMLHESLVDIEEDRYEAAIPKLQHVIEREPETSSAYLELGRALVHLKKYEEAMPVLKQAVEKMPTSGMPHYELGIALVKTGQWEAALPEFQTAVKSMPKSAQMHFYLAAVFARLKRVPEAAQEFEETIKLEPDHYEANLLYGRMLFLERQPERALPLLLHAAKVEPESRQAHAFLSDAYMVTGQDKKAAQERVLAEHGKVIQGDSER